MAHCTRQKRARASRRGQSNAKSDRSEKKRQEMSMVIFIFYCDSGNFFLLFGIFVIIVWNPFMRCPSPFIVLTSALTFAGTHTRTPNSYFILSALIQCSKRFNRLHNKFITSDVAAFDGRVTRNRIGLNAFFASRYSIRPSFFSLSLSARGRVAPALCAAISTSNIKRRLLFVYSNLSQLFVYSFVSLCSIAFPFSQALANY